MGVAQGWGMEGKGQHETRERNGHMRHMDMRNEGNGEQGIADSRPEPRVDLEMVYFIRIGGMDNDEQVCYSSVCPLGIGS